MRVDYIVRCWGRIVYVYGGIHVMYLTVVNPEMHVKLTAFPFINIIIGQTGVYSLMHNPFSFAIPLLPPSLLPPLPLPRFTPLSLSPTISPPVVF